MLCEVKAFKNADPEPFFTNDRALVVVPDTSDEGKGQLLGLLIEDLGPRVEGKKLAMRLLLKQLVQISMSVRICAAPRFALNLW